jgi:hypothetical protein
MGTILKNVLAASFGNKWKLAMPSGHDACVVGNESVIVIDELVWWIARSPNDDRVTQ